jgi:hypothetical protein
VFTQGHVFEGIFVDGKISGEFKYTSPSVNFQGIFKFGCLDGYVEEETPNYSFKGTLRQGKRYNGELKWSGYCSYKGDFDEEGRFHEKGTLITEFGNYTGEFSKGVKHGQGEYAWKSGLRYVGAYEHGKKQGLGTLYLDDG